MFTVKFKWAPPSDATSLNLWEVHYLVSKNMVGKVMTRQVVQITEDTHNEEAARIMAYNVVGGLPVVRENKVVGIIAETDLFKILLEYLCGRETGPMRG